MFCINSFDNETCQEGADFNVECFRVNVFRSQTRSFPRLTVCLTCDDSFTDRSVGANDNDELVALVFLYSFM